MIAFTRRIFINPNQSNAMNHEETLTRIVRHLTLNYSGLPSPGLLNGKMGGVLFFNLYARHTNKSHYSSVADCLLEDVYAQISENTPVDFASGLCGIGWAVEYLIQNKFAGDDTDSDDILEDIDAKIMEWDVRRISNWSFYTGLSGMLYYVNTRLESHYRQGRKQPFDTIYLQDFLKATENYPPDTESVFTEKLIRRFRKIMQGDIDYDTAVSIPEMLYDSADAGTIENLPATPIGIRDGLTGIALKLMMA